MSRGRRRQRIVGRGGGVEVGVYRSRALRMMTYDGHDLEFGNFSLCTASDSICLSTSYFRGKRVAGENAFQDVSLKWPQPTFRTRHDF